MIELKTNSAETEEPTKNLSPSIPTSASNCTVHSTISNPKITTPPPYKP